MMSRLKEVIYQFMEKLLKALGIGILVVVLLGVVIFVGTWVVLGLLTTGGDDMGNTPQAEQALSETGLSGMEQAAGYCLYLDTHLQDGDTMAIFEVGYSERAALYERIRATEGWREAQIPAADYAAWARNFREPYSLIQPMGDVVFDAMYYQGENGGGDFYADWDWGELPESLGMSEIPYAPDFDVAFYDRDTGLFMFYHQCI